MHTNQPEEKIMEMAEEGVIVKQVKMAVNTAIF